MKLRFLVFFLVCFSIQLSFGADFFWGKTGHRVTGEIASQHLTNRARKAIFKLLDGQSLAIVSTYADEIKSDRQYKKYSPWHYVNFSFDKKYGEEQPNEHGDLVKGIEKCVAVLKDPKAAKKDKAFYLKMLVHFIGDLHQPLHVGRGEDKGGNTIQVRWFNKGSNLHKVWDSEMIDSYGMSYTELANNKAVLSKEEIRKIERGSVLDWVNESQNLAKEVYKTANVGEKLRYRYSYVNFPIVREQLQKGGIRLAKVLNEIFG